MPSPLENATGIVLHVAGPVSARSVRPSALKSPLITFASGVAAHWAKDQSDAVDALMTLNVPSPLENATGIEPHPAGPVNAMSVSPSWLKSPLMTFTPGVAAHWAKYQSGEVDTLAVLNAPFPLENPTGTVAHPEGPVSAMSVRPSWSKSPVTTFALAVADHWTRTA